MLLQTYWLSSLLFTASATASAALELRQNSTASPAIYLVVTDTGTPYDGAYLTVGQAFPEDELDFLLFGSQLPDPSGASVFVVDNDDHTLTHLMSGLIGTYIDPSGPIIMADPSSYAEIGLKLADCGIGRLFGCDTGEATITYASVSQSVAGGYTTPHVLLGPYVPPEEGAVEIIVLPIPL